jgi:hypothetical protein
MHQEFLETDYIVFKNQLFKKDVVLKINQIADFIYFARDDLKTCAFITAWNPLPETLSLDVNKSRNLELKDDLIAQGYDFHNGIGVSADKKWSEESYFIEDIVQDAANEIALKYGQKAFVFIDADRMTKLIYTISNVY